MIAVAAFVVGALTSALLWAGMASAFGEASVLTRRNYRDHELPVAAGAVVVLAVVGVSAIHTLVVGWNEMSVAELQRGATLGLGGAAGLALGFGFLGLFDDLAGGASTKGFRGHLRALAHGTVTSGLVKLVGGVLVAVALVASSADPSTGGVDTGSTVRGGLLVAAAANLGNLFDRAPGRVIKVSLLGALTVAATGAPGWHLTGPMLVIGAGAGLLVADLRERCMLGDTGSNVLGAAVGWGLVLSLGTTGEWVALAIVVAGNLASEVVSFSSVIDRVAPLRWFDRWGTLPERRSHGSGIRAGSGGTAI